MTRALLGVSAGLGMTAAMLLSAAPAFAAPTDPLTRAQCAALAVGGGETGRLGIRPGQDAVLTADGGGFFVSEENVVHVFCTNSSGNVDAGFITDVSVTVTAVDNQPPPGTTFEVAPALGGPWSPGTTGFTAAVNPANGNVSFFIRSNSPEVTGATVAITVGQHTETTTACTGTPGCTVFNGGPITVVPGATPELSSVALFGSGALGMAGFAFARLRAKRREQNS
jgi:hypothetical protein